MKATALAANWVACPFCGAGHSLVHGESVGFCRIECEECGAAGPVADNDDDALTLWSQRVDAQDAGSIN
ncbi:Lar family restriction alleviation protein [Serratia fonticola]|uniref:Lar family restriction alleviation protein n=1 Tax=Serratia fonticola TaxID=47917 RepID=UPI003AFA0D93